MLQAHVAPGSLVCLTVNYTHGGPLRSAAAQVVRLNPDFDDASAFAYKITLRDAAAVVVVDATAVPAHFKLAHGDPASWIPHPWDMVVNVPVVADPFAE